MSQVTVEKIDTKKSLPPERVDEMNSLSDRIRQRAYELFQGRGGFGDSAIDDWLAAERHLFRIPESELIERDGKFEARLSAPGFNPDEVKITALPNALIINGSSHHSHDETEKGVRFCEFDQRSLFRRFDLPEPIDVDHVTANLDKGVLCVTAAKSNQGSTSGNSDRTHEAGGVRRQASR